MPDTTTRAQEIRAELDRLAPYRAVGPVTARELARYLLAEAQVVWARCVTRGSEPRAQDSSVLTGFYAAAHALYVLSLGDLIVADRVAQRIRDAWEDGGNMGEWIWEHLGGDAALVGALAEELASVTAPAESAPKPAGGVLVDPADLRAALEATGVLPDAVYDRLCAAAGVAG